jgi:hypothetical protein
MHTHKPLNYCLFIFAVKNQENCVIFVTGEGKNLLDSNPDSEENTIL